MYGLGPRIPTHYGWGHGSSGCNDTCFSHHLNKNTNIYIYINIYFTAILRDEIKKLGKQQSDRADDLMSWAS
jgi:hypothetical protein